jgi:hypothetical protein
MSRDAVAAAASTTEAMGGSASRTLSRLLRGDLVAVGVLTAVAAIVRFVALGHQSFWIDEAITSNLLAKSLPSMLAALPHSESAPPLYYVIAWSWSRVFGSGEAAVRSLSALAGTLTVPFAFAAGRALVSRRTGLFAAALAAVSPLLVWYSQEARAYALFVLLGAISLLLFARALDDPSARTLAWWAVGCSLTLATHYFAVFLIAGEAAFSLHRHRRRATILATGGIAAVALALLPLVAYQAKHASSAWIREVDLRLRVEETFAQLFIPNVPSIWGGAGVPESAGRWWPLGVLVLVGGAASALVFGRARHRRGAAISLLVGLAAILLPLALAGACRLVASGRGDVFLFRNAIDAWLPLTIAIAAGFASLRAARLGTLAFAGLWAASLAVLVVNSTTAHLQRDDWRLVADATRGPGRAVIVSPSWQSDALRHYAPQLAPATSAQRLREIDLLLRRSSPAYLSTVRAFEPPPGFRRVGTRTLQNWELTVFRAPRGVKVTPAQLARARPSDASRIALETRVP